MWNNITAQPLIEPISLERYLNGIELVVAGGESDRNARPLITTGYWVLDINIDYIVNEEAQLAYGNSGMAAGNPNRFSIYFYIHKYHPQGI